jgi:hypothetical protein
MLFGEKRAGTIYSKTSKYRVSLCYKHRYRYINSLNNMDIKIILENNEKRKY